MITWHANHESSCTQINEHDAAKWTAGVHHVVNRCTIAVRVGAAEAAQGGAACDRATASGLSGEEFLAQNFKKTEEKRIKK